MRPPWTVRRRLINATLGFCAGGLVYLLLYGSDTRLHETMAFGFFGTAVSVLGAYVFGAAWDDMNVMRLLGRGAYQPEARREPQFEEYPTGGTDADVDYDNTGPRGS